MTQREADLSKISKRWALSPEQLQQRVLISWMEHEHIKRYIHRRITGDESLDWFTYVLRKYFLAPAERALSLGCGQGGLERHALSSNAVHIFDAYDASYGAIEHAKKAAEKEGLLKRINYHIADMNLLELPEKIYDAVFASMSVHHVEALERLFGEVRGTLKPYGLFIINEYIGPTKFQIPPLQLKLINSLLKILPIRCRRMIRDGKVTDEIKQVHQIHSLKWFDENDPSEAVRSAEIMPVLKDYFQVLEFKPYGGTLLHFMLENIVGNFDDRDEDDRAWLNMLEYLETVLEEGGVIKSDFALIVARTLRVASHAFIP